jgi:chaperonin GroES
MNVRVQGERILVKQDEKKETTVGGLYLPESSDKKRPSLGTIVAVGNGNHVSSMLKESDRVMFDQFSGIIVDIDGSEYKVLNYIDVLMTL